MTKWRHVRIGCFSERMEIFPRGAISLDWLFTQFPKIKMRKESDNSHLVLEVKADQEKIVEEAILHFLEDNGWEAYAYSINYNVSSFKRQEA